MKNILQEEIQRIRLLSKYNNKITLSENKVLILELNPKLLSLFRKIKNSDSEVMDALKKLEYSGGFNKKLVSLTNKDGKKIVFNGAEDLVKNIDKLDNVAKANLISDLYKKSDGSLKDEISDAISKSDGFIEKYSKFTSYDDAIEELKKVGGYTDEEAKLLLDKSGVKFNKLPVKQNQIQTINTQGFKKESKLKSVLKKVKNYTFKNKWKIFAGLGAIIWWLSNDESKPFPLCLVNKLKPIDVEKFKSETPDFILISSLGDKELDMYGGGKFYINGDFESGNGQYEGTWDSSSDTEVIIELDSGKEYKIPCSGLQDPNSGTSIPTTSDQTKKCDTFPFTKGCINTKITEIQKCLKIKETSILDDETEKKLDELYGTTKITQVVYDNIMKNCKQSVKPKPEFIMSTGAQSSDV